jgi:beta-phosphoglucomutase-like phosphatase (HAD superfamily)
MRGEKQSRVEVLEKKVEALIRVIQQLLDENAYLKDLSVGTLETIKLMPNYEEAIEELKKKALEESSEGEEVKTS